MDLPTHFFVHPPHSWHVVPCRADGTTEPAPMRPSSAPPVYTGYWSDESYARYDAVAKAGQRAFDAWHEVWGMQSFWKVDRTRIIARPAEAR